MEEHHHNHHHNHMHGMDTNSTDNHSHTHPDYANHVGHTVPGTIFVIYGIRWIYCTLYRYYLCRREAESGRKVVRKYESTLLQNSSLWPKMPFDAILGMFGSTLGFIVELFHFEPTGYALHNLLYVSFGLTSFVDYISKRSRNLPKHSEYFQAVIAMWANGMLLYTHSKRHDPLDSEIHKRLLVTVIFTSMFLILEIIFINKVLISIARSFGATFMGCWYITIAHVLYPIWHSKHFDDSHMSLMKLEVLFVSEMLILSAIVLITGSLAQCRVKRMNSSQVSAALDNDYYFIVRQNRQLTSEKYLDDTREPLLSSDGDSDQRCCI